MKVGKKVFSSEIQNVSWVWNRNIFSYKNKKVFYNVTHRFTSNINK